MGKFKNRKTYILLFLTEIEGLVKTWILMLINWGQNNNLCKRACQSKCSNFRGSGKMWKKERDWARGGQITEPIFRNCTILFWVQTNLSVCLCLGCQGCLNNSSLCAYHFKELKNSIEILTGKWLVFNGLYTFSFFPQNTCRIQCALCRFYLGKHFSHITLHLIPNVSA